ncbi:SRPBCC family protein [Bacillus cereus]
MAHTTTSMEIFGSPEQVWQLIGGFNSFQTGYHIYPSSKLTEGGRVRHLANPDGDTIIERLEVFNEKERYYTYSIINAPFPVTNYLSTIQVKESTESNTSVVEWSGTFTPVEVSDEEAINLFHGIYSDGLKALQQAYF